MTWLHHKVTETCDVDDEVRNPFTGCLVTRQPVKKMPEMKLVSLGHCPYLGPKH